MSSLHRSAVATSGKKARAGRRGGDPAGAAGRVGERLAAAREDLVQERQAELQRVTERHDGLIREVFQLDKFVSLLAYDPKIAKEDNSPVFQEYKAPYDLLRNTSTASVSVRKTRRGFSERLQSLKVTAEPPTPSAASAKKKATRKKQTARAPEPAPVAEIWNILADAKAKDKGKGKAREVDEGESISERRPKGASAVARRERGSDIESEDDSSASVVDVPVSASQRRSPVKARQVDFASSISRVGAMDPPKTPGPSASGGISRTKSSSPTKRAGVPTPSAAADSPSVSRKRRKLDHPTITHPSGLASQGAPIIGAHSPRVPHTTPRRATMPASISSIKRVRLIVRAPPPLVSHPAQRPPPHTPHGSLRAFLQSYTMLDVAHLSAEQLEKRARREAAVRETARSLGKEGRWLPPGVSFDVNSKEGAGSADVVGGAPPRDLWAAVVGAVTARARTRTRAPTGVQVAASVASKVRGYWEGRAVREERARMAEEKRLKALAKATIRFVVGEWKKAVFHIREQDRLKAEEEEQKRGRAHLDDILGRSGQILEAQQVDLSKPPGGERGSRSRSSSVFSASLTLRGWGEEADEEDGSASDEDEDEEEDGEEEEEDVDSDDEENLKGNRGNSELDELAGAAVEELWPEDTFPGESVDGASSERSVSRASVSSLGIDYASADEDESHPDHVHDADADPDSDASSLPLASPFTPAFDENEDDEDTLRGPDADVDLNDATVLGPSPTPPPPSIRVDPTPPSLDSPDAVLALLGPFPGPESELFGSDALSPAHAPSALPALSSSSSTASPAASSPADPERLVTAAAAHHVTDPHRRVSALRTNGVVIEAEAEDMAVDVPDEEKAAPVVVVTVSDDASPALRHEPLGGTLEGTYVNGDAPAALFAAPDDHGELEDDDDDDSDDDNTVSVTIPAHLRPYAVAPVEWDAQSKMKPPFLLRGTLRPYQQSGLEWLASLHTSNLNGILADEMGLGKTIQTIALLAHLACDRGIWGPHLIIVPTSVILNWEMEFKKFLPGFRVLGYHGSTKRRKELRQGWNSKDHFNVCVTSYTLASRDAHIFKRKAWYYMILDEAHMIKNFKSQRWNILLMFRSFRRLLLTGTPLQNNLTELWALLQFLMSGTTFANLKEFGEWFSNPLEKAIEMGNTLDDETQQRVGKLHTVLRPYLLRRLKRDVEKELPSKYEHLVLCPLSKRQRFLYDEFMSRRQTRDDLHSGTYHRIANILMQLRKVCNHPDLFEVRQIVTSFAMERSAIADFEIEELLVRRRFLQAEDETEKVNLDVLGLRFIDREDSSLIAALETRRLDGTSRLPYTPLVEEVPPKDFRTVDGFRRYEAYRERAGTAARWAHIGYLNRLRCKHLPVYSSDLLGTVRKLHKPLLPLSALDRRVGHFDVVLPLHAAVRSYEERAEQMADIVDKFAFVTPAVVALDLPELALPGAEGALRRAAAEHPGLDRALHRASVKLQIAFPDPSLLQYDCGKLQTLYRLLRTRRAGGHRVLIFTQMTKILDILEMFLNIHGYLYLRLDGATKIEDRQYITERFNADPRIFCFISSSRSGGVGINLTGADTVIFYDSDFNPQMDRQCEDRAHRIGQIRDVHIYRFISQHTVEEALLRKANQKRSLDDLVIQKGEFDWRALFTDENAMTAALGEVEDQEDAHAAAIAAREVVALEGADEADFGDADAGTAADTTPAAGKGQAGVGGAQANEGGADAGDAAGAQVEEEEEEEGGTTVDRMLAFVQFDREYFDNSKVYE